MSLDRRTKRRLARLSPGARRELIMVLGSPSNVRADLIRQMYERPEARDLAEVLMDLEADPTLRAQVTHVISESLHGAEE